MEAFCRSRENADLRRKLENSIHGSGAFKRFRTAVEQAGILEEWYAFKNSEDLQIAKQWCEEHGVEVEEEKILE